MTTDEQLRFSNDAALLRRRLLLEYSAIRPFRPRYPEILIYLSWLYPVLLWCIVAALHGEWQQIFYGFLVIILFGLWMLLGLRDGKAAKSLPKDKSGKVTLDTLDKRRSRRKKSSKLWKWPFYLMFAIWIAGILHHGLQEGGDRLIRSIATASWISVLCLVPSALRTKLQLHAQCVKCDGQTHPRAMACQHCNHDLRSVYGMYIPKQIVAYHGNLLLVIILSAAYIVLSLVAGPIETVSNSAG